MAEYDQIGEERLNADNEKTYNGQDFGLVCAAFQHACRKCNPEDALSFALEAYLVGGYQRSEIIRRLFQVVFEDKGLADPTLFLRVYQLIVPLLTRAGDEISPFEEGTGIETWKGAYENPLYEVSNLGQVRNVRNGEILMQTNRERFNY